MKTQTSSVKTIHSNTRLGRIGWLDLGVAVLMGSLVSLHSAEVVGWGANYDGQTSVPPGLNNVVGIAGGQRHSIALRRDGTVIAWGGQTYVPAELNSVVAIAAGDYNLALRANGRVTAWNAQQVIPMPADWTNVVAIATHAYGEILALRADGTVVAWNANPSNATSLPAGLRHVVAIASGIALRANGTVVSLGGNFVPAEVTNVVAIAAGMHHYLALRADGTVLRWGGSSPDGAVPEGLSNVVAISAGWGHSLALKDDGTVVGWGMSCDANDCDFIPVPAGLSSVVAISSGTWHNLALLGQGPPAAPAPLANRTVLRGETAFFHMPAVGGLPLNYQWLCNGTNLPGATGPTLVLTNVQMERAGHYSLRVQNAWGTLLHPGAALTVLPLLITNQPVSQSGFLGGTVSFTVQAQGAGPFSHQWRFDGADIDGATNAELVLTNLQFSQTGEYSVVVSNPFGSVPSDTAWLEVSPVAAWGYSNYDLNQAPQGLGAAVAIAGGAEHHLALLSNGTVVGWGYYYDRWGYVPMTVPTGLSNVTAISAGIFHSLALRTDGTIAAWGTYLDKGNAVPMPVPADVSNVVAVASGNHHALALRAGGTVIAWGANDWGQASVPADVTTAVALAAGRAHSLALRSDGTVAAWGSGDATNIPAGLNNVVAIAAGEAFSLALRADGTVTAWGSNHDGQTNVPAGLDNVAAVAAGWAHSLALRKDGTVVAWGSCWPEPANVPAGLSNVAAVAACWTHSLALVGQGPPALPPAPGARVVAAASTMVFTAPAVGAWPLSYQWQFNGTDLPGATGASLILTNVQLEQAGSYSVIVSNASGVTTHAGMELHVLPLLITSPPVEQRRLLGQAATLTVQAQGPALAYQWRFNGVNLPDATNASLELSPLQFSQTGEYSVVVSNQLDSVTSDAVWVDVSAVAEWGDEYGEEMEPVATPLGLNDVVSLAAGYYHRLALRSDGTLRAWGSNSEGQTNVPAGARDIVAVAAGYYHSLALRSDGTVIGWGSYPDCDYEDISPVFVPAGLSNVVGIAAGLRHSLALCADGSVRAWGIPCDPAGDPVTVPAGLSDVVAVAAGWRHSLALRRDGTVVAWGYSYYGQTNVPPDLRDVVAIAAGESFSLALRVDGTVAAWGQYYDEDHDRPMYVPDGLSNVVAIAAGEDHCLALKANRTVVAWGWPSDYDGPGIWQDLTNVVAIAAGGPKSMALLPVSPRLTIQRDESDQLCFEWLSAQRGWILEETADLGSGTWTNVVTAGLPALLGVRTSVSIACPEGPRFFRLRSP